MLSWSGRWRRTPAFRDEREFFDALLAASGLERADLHPTAPSRCVAATAMDDTVVPDLDRVEGAAKTAPAGAASPVRMVPTIRTKRLAPRSAGFSRFISRGRETSAPRVARIPLLGGLLAAQVAAGIVLLLWKYPAPKNTSIETTVRSADTPDATVSPSPSPTPDTVSATPPSD